MMAQQSEERYQVRVFDYSEDGPGRYPIMMVRFEPTGNPVLERTGFRNGKYTLFMRIAGGAEAPTYDARKFANRFTARDDDSLRAFLQCVDDGVIPFDAIEDGELVTPVDIKDYISTYLPER